MTSVLGERLQLHNVLGEATRFLGLGVVSYSLGIAMSALLREVVHLSAEAAVALSLAILVVVNFWLSRLFVFRASGSARRQFLWFLGTAIPMRATEYGLFFLLFKVLMLHYLVSLTLGMALSTCAKFFLYRRVVFGTSLNSGRPGQ